MPCCAQSYVQNPDIAAIPRQPHRGPRTYIGGMFAGLFAKSCKIPTGCAFLSSRKQVANNTQPGCSEPC